MVLTGTYKLKKKGYEEVGYNIFKTDDPIYLLQNNKYIKLSPELYDDILTGKLRL